MADIKIYGKLTAMTEDQTVADASSIQDTTNSQKLNVTLAAFAESISGLTESVGSLNTSVSGKQATLSSAQLAAANSGVTADKVSSYDSVVAAFAQLGSAANKTAGSAAGNVPVLDSNGKLSADVLPAIAITDTYVVNSENNMLALTAQVGDIAVRSDINKCFILKTAGADSLSHWQELLTPPDTVISVNGKTGAVTISIPTKVSDLDNDSGFVTSSHHDSSKQDSLSTAQLNAANSGITSSKVSGYDSHLADATIHVTSSEKATWNAKQNALTFDTTPTAESPNPVTSAGIKTALDGKQATLVSGTNIKTIDGQSIVGSGNADSNPYFEYDIPLDDITLIGLKYMADSYYSQQYGTTVSFTLEEVDGMIEQVVADMANADETVLAAIAAMYGAIYFYMFNHFKDVASDMNLNFTGIEDYNKLSQRMLGLMTTTAAWVSLIELSLGTITYNKEGAYESKSVSYNKNITVLDDETIEVNNFDKQIISADFFAPNYFYKKDANKQYDDFFEYIQAKNAKLKPLKLNLYIKRKTIWDYYLSSTPFVGKEQFINSSPNIGCLIYQFESAFGSNFDISVNRGYFDTYNDSDALKTQPRYKNLIHFFGNLIYTIEPVWQNTLKRQNFEQYNPHALDIDYATGIIKLNSNTSNMIDAGAAAYDAAKKMILQAYYQLKCYRLNFFSYTTNEDILFNGKSITAWAPEHPTDTDANPYTGLITSTELLSSDFVDSSSSWTLVFQNLGNYSVVDEKYHSRALFVIQNTLMNYYFVASNVTATEVKTIDEQPSGTYYTSSEQATSDNIFENFFYAIYHTRQAENGNTAYEADASIPSGIYAGWFTVANKVYKKLIFATTTTKISDALSAYITAHPDVVRQSGHTYEFTMPTNKGPLNYGYLKETIKYYVEGVCLALDTPITMADGTRKQAKDVEIGDEILTKSGPDKVVWIDSYMEKSYPHHHIYTFEGNRKLVIAHDHRVYSVEDKKYKHLSEWHIGEHALTEDGQKIALLKDERINKPLKHCIVYTLNDNSQYANGILTGNKLANIKWRWLRHRGARWYLKYRLLKETKGYAKQNSK